MQSNTDGWKVVTGTFVVQMLSIGFFTYSVSLLTPHIMQEFGTGMQEVMWALTLGTFAGLIFMPLGGELIDRFSPKLIMSLGTAAFAVGLYLTAKATTIGQYTTMFGLTMAITYGLAGSTVSSATVSRWFTDNRGKALGVSATGTSIGGAIVPLLISYLLTSYSWRETLEIFSLCIIVLALPAILIFIKRPIDQQLNPLHTATTLTTKDILLNRNFWLIGTCLGLLFCAYSATLANLSPYALSTGISHKEASVLISLLAIFGFIGKLSLGYAADKIDLKISLAASCLLVAASLFAFSQDTQYEVVVGFVCVLGLASGGMLPIWGAIIAKVFGLSSFGRAMGLMGPVITLMVMPGYTIMGSIYDHFQSYQPAMLAFSLVAILAAFFIIPVKIRIT